jgi:hypothetical protein
LTRTTNDLYVPFKFTAHAAHHSPKARLSFLLAANPAWATEGEFDFAHLYVMLIEHYCISICSLSSHSFCLQTHESHIELERKCKSIVTFTVSSAMCKNGLSCRRLVCAFTHARGEETFEKRAAKLAARKHNKSNGSNFGGSDGSAGATSTAADIAAAKAAGRADAVWRPRLRLVFNHVVAHQVSKFCTCLRSHFALLLS